MFNFGGNPLVIQLLESPTTTIDNLLDIDTFPSQFRTSNPKLQKYMTIQKYNTLVSYITEIGDPNNKKRSYKYPLQAAEILSIDNNNTIDALLMGDRDGKIKIEKQIEEEVWIEKQVDQCDSQYCSSEGSSNRVGEELFEKEEDRENIPPIQGDVAQSRNSSQKKKKFDKNQKNSDSSSQDRKSLNGSSISVTSDDFPFVQQTVKKIKIKKIVRRKIQIQIKPLIQQLCQYFQKQPNFTLIGYIVRVLQLVLKKNPKRLLRELFMTKVHKSLIKCVQSHVLCDFIVNLVLCEEPEAENAREYFVSLLAKSLLNWGAQQDQVMVVKSVVYMLMEINAKLDPHSSKWHTILLQYLYQESSLPKLSQSLFQKKSITKHKEQSCMLLLQYLKKLLSPIIINPPNTAQSAIRTTQNQIIKELRYKILSKFQLCFKEFVDKVWQNVIEIETTQIGNEQCMPSFVYIKMFQILNVLIKNDLFWARMELSNQENVIGPLLGLCNKFWKNNFLHNQVFQLLKQIVHNSNDNPLLFKKTFSNKIFLNFCLDTITQPSQALYRGQCIYLCETLRHNTSPECLSLKSQFTSKWSKIQQLLLQNIQKINSTLGGFSVKRPHKISVQFNKQQILKKFGNFLRSELPLKKKKTVQQEELEDIASQGSTEWNDWSQFSNYRADQVDDKNGGGDHSDRDQRTGGQQASIN